MRMSSIRGCHGASMAFVALLLWIGASHDLQAEPVSAPATPIGRWVAEHPSKGGIGSWWEFRADGTLTCFYGAMATGAVSRSGDVLTMPSATVGGPPVIVHFRVSEKTLEFTGNGVESFYVRIGAAPSKSDLLLGTWRPAPGPISGDPKMAALEKVQAQAVYVFTADGNESVRMPFGSREGTWDAQMHRFHFPDDPVMYAFELAGAKLVLGQPPDGKVTDTYLRDPVM